MELAIHGAPDPRAEEIPLRPLRIEDPLPGLWSYAVMIWYELTGDLVGHSSAELMRRQYISGNSHRIIGDWLRNLEKLVRRILLIAALALDLKPAKPAPRRPWGAPGFRTEIWSDPTSWRVSFHMLERGRSARRARIGKRRRRDPEDPADWRSPARPAWRFARRIEALRRVLSFQQDAARRLARQLARIRARNAAANTPRRLKLAVWDFTPERRTTGKHAIAEPMSFADPLSREEVWKWEQPG